MKIGTIIFVSIALSIVLGAFPLILVARIFELIATALRWIGRFIDWFGWGGMLVQSVGYCNEIYNLGGFL